MAKKKSQTTTKVGQPHPQKEQTTKQIDEQLLLAAFRGDLSEVNACLEKGANVNARDQYGYSALNEAAREGHLEVVKRLVEAGADIENTGGADITPLMSAAFAGQFDIVEFLLAKGAEVRNDLLSNVQLKVNILKENAEAGSQRERRSWNGASRGRGSLDVVSQVLAGSSDQAAQAQDKASLCSGGAIVKSRL